MQGLHGNRSRWRAVIGSRTRSDRDMHLKLISLASAPGGRIGEVVVNTEQSIPTPQQDKRPHPVDPKRCLRQQLRRCRDGM